MTDRLCLRLPSALLEALQEQERKLTTYQPGATTALGAAAAAKRCDVAMCLGNAELSSQQDAEVMAKLYQFLSQSEVRDFALPRVLFGWRFVRYNVGDRYGQHTDEAYEGRGRADLSFTIVLRAADEGGHLVIGGRGEGKVMHAGDCVIYPSTTVHEVTEVRAGKRVVLVGWIESMVRDAGKRALLADLNYIVENDYEPERVRAVRNELLRRWCQ